MTAWIDKLAQFLRIDVVPLLYRDATVVELSFNVCRMTLKRTVSHALDSQCIRNDNTLVEEGAHKANIEKYTRTNTEDSDYF